MKKIVLAFIGVALLSACSTIQSIVRSTLPYTATLVVPSSTSPGTARSAVSTASSLDQVFGSTNANIKEVRVTSARLEASNPSNQSLGVFSSIRLYLGRADGSGEIMVAGRSDVSSTVGNSIVLDIDNSKFLDEIVKGSSARIRMEYVLRNSLTVDASFRAVLNFSSVPATAQ